MLPKRFVFGSLAAATLLGQIAQSFAAEIARTPMDLDSGNLRALLEVARKDARAEKKSLLAENISLTEDEAARFWPVYAEYERELRQWYEWRFSMIKEYTDRENALSDGDARKLAEEVFFSEEDRIKLKRRYYKRFSKVVGAKKAVRIFQIENQLSAATDLRLSAALPLIK